MWTQFWDMHSGGKQKLYWSQIFIEAPEDQAIVEFVRRFGRHPDHVTCQCCGADYAVREYETLKDATAFERRAYDVKGYPNEMLARETVAVYVLRNDVLVISCDELDKNSL